MNYNTKIALDKIPGYREEYLQDAAGNTTAYACIPLNDRLGILTNHYVDGWNRKQFTEHAYLRLEIIETREHRYGTHIILPGVSKEALQRTDEQTLRRRPILGNLYPWGTKQPEDK